MEQGEENKNKGEETQDKDEESWSLTLIAFKDKSSIFLYIILYYMRCHYTPRSLSGFERLMAVFRTHLI